MNYGIFDGRVVFQVDFSPSYSNILHSSLKNGCYTYFFPKDIKQLPRCIGIIREI